MYNELKSQIKFNDEQLMDKIRLNKKTQNDFEELVDKNFCTKILFDDR